MIFEIRILESYKNLKQSAKLKLVNIKIHIYQNPQNYIDNINFVADNKIIFSNFKIKYEFSNV